MLKLILNASKEEATVLVYGSLAREIREDLALLLNETEGMPVHRSGSARSKNPFPTSQDLELALCSCLEERGFLHHYRLAHPRTGDSFEYDFWRSADGMAMEIMGYRADDEVYKDILKFHVHQETQIGVVWVPRYKWISNRRTDTNYAATTKALAFADSYLDVEALVMLPYDWEESSLDEGYFLRHFDEHSQMNPCHH